MVLELMDQIRAVGRGPWAMVQGQELVYANE